MALIEIWLTEIKKHIKQITRKNGKCSKVEKLCTCYKLLTTTMLLCTLPLLLLLLLLLAIVNVLYEIAAIVVVSV